MVKTSPVKVGPLTVPGRAAPGDLLERGTVPTSTAGLHYHRPGQATCQWETIVVMMIIMYQLC